MNPSKQTSARHTATRSIAIGCALLLLSLTAFAFSHREQQSQQQPSPQSYQNSFQVARPVTRAKPASKTASTQTPASPSPTSTAPTVPAPRPAATQSPTAPTATAPAPPATTPAPKPRTPAERLYTALTSLAPLPFHSTTIVIDPAHGGADSGSRISDSIVEKDVTLALAFRLRSLLTARGFNVVLTRADDKATNGAPPFAPLTLDDRAGIANHERPSACLLLHATARGNGVHLYTSELTPTQGELTIEPWLTSQAPWVTQSQRLANSLSEAFNRAHVPLVDGSASVRPLDSLSCPALILELAPDDSDDPDSINDAGFQQRVALAVANALIAWKNTVQPPPHLAPPEPTATETTP